MSSAGPAPLPGPADGAPAPRPLLLHVVPTLDVGGAEVMLTRLLASEAAAAFDHRVLSLMAGGVLAERIEAAGIEVTSAGMTRGRPTPASVARLVRHVRRRRPHLLVGWLYHGNLAATFAGCWLRPRPPVVWNIRHSPDNLAAEKRLTSRLIRLGARFSGGAAAVVYNSAAAERQHRRLGYAEAAAVVLPNGFDTCRFAPSAQAGAALRRRLGLPSDALLVGRIGRYHAMKGFELFLAAAGGLAAGRPELHLVLAGRGVGEANAALADAVESAGLAGRVTLLGEQERPEALLAGLDAFCSSSLFGEGFPNVVAEAMACGVPCVVTDVGDSAYVVGETGAVVPPGDEAALTRALAALLDREPEERRRLGRAARQRIVELFSAQAVFPRYAAVWRRSLGERLPRGARA